MFSIGAGLCLGQLHPVSVGVASGVDFQSLLCFPFQLPENAHPGRERRVVSVLVLRLRGKTQLQFLMPVFDLGPGH